MTRLKRAPLAALLLTLACGDDPTGAQKDPVPVLSALEVLEAPLTATTGTPVKVRVRAVDDADQVMANLPLTAAVMTGGGTVDPPAPVTDPQGQAVLTWTLGSAPGSQRISVRSGNVAVEVTVDAVDPPVLTSLQVISAPDTAKIADTVSVTLAALDQRGEGMPRVTLQLEISPGQGTLEQTELVTDRLGRIRASWVLGLDPGPYTLVARAEELTAEVPVTVIPRTLGTFGPVTGGGQEGPVGWTLEEPLVARLLDDDGRPLPGFPLQWTVVSGGGTVEPASGLTDADGVLSATWTLGPAEGQQLVQVRASDGQGRTLSVGLSANAFAGVRIRTELPGGREGRLYDEPLEAWGGRQGSPYTWSVAQGALPPGLTLDPAGVLRGAPTTQGSFPFTLQAADDAGASGERGYDVRVCEGLLTLQVGERHLRSWPSPCGPMIPVAGSGVYRVGLMARGSGDVFWTQPVPGGLRFGTTPATDATAPLQAEGPGWTPPPPRPADRRPLDVLSPDAGVDPNAGLRRILSRGPVPVWPSVSGWEALGAAGAQDPPAQRTFLVWDGQRVVEVQATLRATSQTMLYYEDDGLVAGGGTPSDLATITEALEWHDRNGHPVIMESFGGYGPVGTTRSFHDGQGTVMDLPVGDLDRNGKAIALQLRPAYLNGVQGFATACDLLPRPEHAVDPSMSCEKSNEGEIVYVRGPGRYLLAHELKHVSSQGWAIYGSGAINTGWIEEGTAVVASELASRRAAGMASGRRVDGSDLFVGGDTPGTTSDLYLMWAAVEGARRYLAAAPYSAITGDPDPNPQNSSFYTASWLFHRYVLDRYGAGNPGALMRRLNTDSRGVAGLEALTGRTLAELFTELMEAVLVDDVPDVWSATTNRFRSYDFGDIMAGGGGGRWPGFVGDVGFGDRAWNLPTWETASNLFQLRASGFDDLVLDVHSGSGGAVPPAPDVVLLLLRVR